MRRVFITAGIVAVFSTVAPAMALDATGLSTRLEATLVDLAIMHVGDNGETKP